MRLEQRHDHLDRRARVPNAGLRIAILLHGGNEVADRQHIAGVQAAVLERLRLANAVRADGNPLFAGARRCPRAVRQETGAWQIACGHLDDAFAAKNRQAKTIGITGGAADGPEVGRNLAGQGVGCADVVAGKRTDAFVARLDVPGRHRLAALPGIALAPKRITSEVMGQVKHMRAEHPQILATAAVVLLAVELEL